MIKFDFDFYKDEFFNELLWKFEEYSYDSTEQSLYIYQTIPKFFTLSELMQNPRFFVSGLIILNALLQILNEQGE